MCNGLLLLLTIIEHLHSHSVKEVFLQTRTAGAAQMCLLLPGYSLVPEVPIVILGELTILILALGLTSCVNLSKPLSSLGATSLTYVNRLVLSGHSAPVERLM